MDRLRHKRSHLKGGLTRLENLLAETPEDQPTYELRAKLEKLERFFDQYRIMDLEMANHEDPPADREEELEEFENRYLRLKYRITEMLEARHTTGHVSLDPINSTAINADAIQRLMEAQTSVIERLSSITQPSNDTLTQILQQQTSLLQQIGSSGSQSNTSNFHNEVRLPKLNIPVFDGKYSDFKSFIELFDSAVHANTALTNSQRFQYLKGLLKGDPINLIRHLALTDENYTEARAKLTERYNKPSLVVSSLITTFFNIPKADTNQLKILRNVANTADEVVRGLRSLGPDAEKRDPWLIHILLQKVDRETHQAWAEHCGKITYPTLNNFFEFIHNRCDAFEKLPFSAKSNGKRDETSTKVSRTFNTTVSRQTCPKCSQPHHLAHCSAYLKLSSSDRLEFVKSKKLCINCLKPNHVALTCYSRGVCIACKARHHSSIHEARPDEETEKAILRSVAVPNTKPDTNVNTSITLVAPAKERKFSHTLLPTAKVFLKDNMGNLQGCTVLLDSGSQNTLISEACVQRLGLSRKPAKLFINGFAEMQAGVSKGMTEIKLHNMHNEELMSIKAYIFKSLTSNLPIAPISINFLNTIKHLSLADPQFDMPKPIDLIIGCDYFFSLIEDGQIKNNDKVVAQNTKLGWILCGDGCLNEDLNYASCFVVTPEPNDDLDQLLKKFWELEKIPDQGILLTPEEQQAEDLFVSTTTRAVDGRYSVRLPFKSANVNLGTSYNIALKRLQNMERKFKTNVKLHEDYKAFMRDYESSGHMESIPKTELNVNTAKTYYLPHHAVLKENSLTTKLRVVFDGSCKTSNGESLNENLLKGPPLHQDLFAVILRYRCFKYCFSTDIKQMFRMIEVQKCDRDYQRILWRESPNDEIQHFRLNTVTYGTTSAPYLSIRTLLQLSEDEQTKFPAAAKILKNNFYVDDCMAGCNSVEEAQVLVSQLRELLMAGGFQLRKWAANESSILESVPESDRIESISVDIPAENNVSLLGISWTPNSDCFSYCVKTKEFNLNSKRNLLSEISKLFDPLGWVSPAIIAVKTLIQRLWLLQLEWDDPLPVDVKNEAQALFNEFHLLNQIIIPRFLFSTETDVQFHGFCDASSIAYAAVIYCRRRLPDGSFTCKIVISKSKVAPISPISIPRLELCAAQLLTRLSKYLFNSICSVNRNIICWSDSKTVLAWLSSHPSKWKTFVSNRTAYILENLPSAKWKYVPTKENPADYASRGVLVSVLLNNKLWFEGPDWLQQEEEFWPKTTHNIEINDEIRGNTKILLTNTEHCSDVIEILNENISSWRKMIRVLAYCFRIYKILKTKLKDNFPLRVTELEDARLHIIKYYQHLHFTDAIHYLQSNRSIVKHKMLRKLSPFLDDNSLLRVGGRLTYSSLPYHKKHPLILHKDAPIVKKIILNIHQNNLHAGITLVLATLRQEFWIIGARDAVKAVIQQCTVCFRHNAKTLEQQMSNLPKYRVNAIYPFYEVGCDYAGPILYKQHNGRKAPVIKAYVAVFICLVTKAVHLELVSDLSSAAFMAALERFVARRGVCGHIHSDNGTNFVGAAKKLKELHNMVNSEKTNIANSLSSKGIQWHFIPPAAPHFGGAWEAAVKSMKFHLTRAMGESKLTFEELSTLLTRIESILNSRPLVYFESDDWPYLTPGHFLIGRPLNALPEADLTSSNLSSLTRWRLVQQITQSFWHRWSTEYLTSLQPRNKWVQPQPNLQQNDVVLLKGEHVPPACWKLAKIIETHAGADGLVRVATIKTESGIYKRPVTKLCLLPKSC